MRRVQVYLEESQVAELRARSRRFHRSLSGFIREAIDERLAASASRPDFGTALAAVAGIWKDREEMRDVDAFVRRLRQDRRSRIGRQALEELEDVANFDASLAEKGTDLPWEQAKTDLGWD